MKWFKHQTNARDDRALIAVRNEFGFEGYGRYWAILEIVAGRSRNDCFELEIPTTEWCAILATKPQQLRRFLTRAGNLMLFYWSETGNVLKISVPKLAKHRDEYARKSGQTPDKYPDNVRTVDTDTEEEVPSLRSGHTPEKAVKKQTTKTKRRTVIPPDWQPNDRHDRIALSQGVAVLAEAEKFRDYHTAKGSLMLDWDAAFRTWLGNARRFGAPAGTTGRTAQPTRSERIIAAAERVVRKIEEAQEPL